MRTYPLPSGSQGKAKYLPTGCTEDYTPTPDLVYYLTTTHPLPAYLHAAPISR